MKREKSIDKELEKMSPFLKDLRKRESPFDVPKQYFQLLPDVILRKVRQETVGTIHTAGPNWLEQLVASFRWLLQPQYAVGLASSAIILLVGFLIFRPANEVNDVAAPGLSVEELSEYITSNIDEFDMDLLIIASIRSGQDFGMLSRSEFNDQDMDELFEEMLDQIDLNELEDML